MYRWQTILLEEHTYSGVLPHSKTFTGCKRRELFAGATAEEAKLRQEYVQCKLTIEMLDLLN
jgi:hypothetical protein